MTGKFDLIIQKQKMTLTSRFRDALVFASQLHAGQTRKGGSVPYISHLLAVAGMVLDNGGDEDEAIAGLLHDAIEDQGGDHARKKIRQLYGERVVEIVNGCTDADIIPKPPWRPRKEQYLKKLLFASPSVRLVALSDKVHNARSILMDYHKVGEKVWDRFKGGKEGTLWYYRSLVVTFQSGEPSGLVDEFVRLVNEILIMAGKPGISSARR